MGNLGLNPRSWVSSTPKGHNSAQKRGTQLGHPCFLVLQITDFQLSLSCQAKTPLMKTINIYNLLKLGSGAIGKLSSKRQTVTWFVFLYQTQHSFRSLKHSAKQLNYQPNLTENSQMILPIFRIFIYRRLLQMSSKSSHVHSRHQVFSSALP